MADGGVEALRALRASSDFFCEKWAEDGDPAQWAGVKITDGVVTVLKVEGTYSQRSRLAQLPAEVQLLRELTTLEIAWSKRLSKLPPHRTPLPKLLSLLIDIC